MFLPGVADNLRHRKPVPGQLDSRSQHLSQAHRTVAFQQTAPPVQCPGHGDSVNPFFRHLPIAHFPVGFRGGGVRRPAAGIERLKFPAFCQVYQGEGVSPQPGRHRLNHIQRRRRGDGGIDGVASPPQHLHPGLRRQRLTGGHHAPPAHHRGTA